MLSVRDHLVTFRTCWFIALLLAFVTVSRGLFAAVNVQIREVPDYNWYYGCMGTAAGNLMGYWDRHGFPDFYTGPVNGGLAPLSTSGSNAGIIELWATKAGFAGRAADQPGHVDDYYMAYEDTGPDPFTRAGRAEHLPDCLGDFLGLSQLKWDNLRNECRGNIDGYCFVSWEPTGERRFNHSPDATAHEPEVDVQTGLRAWTRWRGYEADVFTQLADVNPAVTPGKGFRFEDLKAEIDAGYPVLLFLQRFDRFSRTLGAAVGVNPMIHAMLAFGYYINNDIPYVRYRTSWADGDNRLKAWTSANWEADLPLRGVIGYHPRPRIREASVKAGNLELRWDGPATDLYDAVNRTTNRVHGYVVESALRCSGAEFEAITPILLTHQFTVTNCPSPAYFRLRLVRP